MRDNCSGTAAQSNNGDQSVLLLNTISARDGRRNDTAEGVVYLNHTLYVEATLHKQRRVLNMERACGNAE